MHPLLFCEYQELIRGCKQLVEQQEGAKDIIKGAPLTENHHRNMTVQFVSSLNVRMFTVSSSV